MNERIKIVVGSSQTFFSLVSFFSIERHAYGMRISLPFFALHFILKVLCFPDVSVDLSSRWYYNRFCSLLPFPHVFFFEFHFSVNELRVGSCWFWVDWSGIWPQSLPMTFWTLCWGDSRMKDTWKETKWSLRDTHRLSLLSVLQVSPSFLLLLFDVFFVNQIFHSSYESRWFFLSKNEEDTISMKENLGLDFTNSFEMNEGRKCPSDDQRREDNRLVHVLSCLQNERSSLRDWNAKARFYLCKFVVLLFADEIPESFVVRKEETDPRKIVFHDRKESSGDSLQGAVQRYLFSLLSLPLFGLSLF